MDSDEINFRLQEWYDHSITLTEINPMMVIVSQRLGRLDYKLNSDIEYIPQSLANVSCEEELMSYWDNDIYSYLWVLGMYELVRSIDQYFSRNIKDANIKNHVKQTKILFERVRMPLAKFEPAKRFPKNEWGDVIGLHTTQGVTWCINPGENVSRNELSDAYLNLLKKLSKYFKRM